MTKNQRHRDERKRRSLPG